MHPEVANTISRSVALPLSLVLFGGLPRHVDSVAGRRKNSQCPVRLLVHIFEFGVLATAASPLPLSLHLRLAFPLSFSPSPFSPPPPIPSPFHPFSFSPSLLFSPALPLTPPLFLLSLYLSLSFLFLSSRSCTSTRTHIFLLSLYLSLSFLFLLSTLLPSLLLAHGPTVQLVAMFFTLVSASSHSGREGTERRLLMTIPCKSTKYHDRLYWGENMADDPPRNM